MRFIKLSGRLGFISILVLGLLGLPHPARAAGYTWLGAAELENPYFRAFLAMMAGIGFELPPIGDNDVCDSASEVCELFEGIADGTVDIVEGWAIDVLDGMVSWGRGVLFPNTLHPWLGPLYNGWHTCAAGSWQEDAQGGYFTNNPLGGQGFVASIPSNYLGPLGTIKEVRFFQLTAGDITSGYSVMRTTYEGGGGGGPVIGGFASPILMGDTAGTYVSRAIYQSPNALPSPGYDYMVVCDGGSEGLVWGFKPYVQVCKYTSCLGDEGVAWMYKEITPALLGAEWCYPDQEVDEDNDWWAAQPPVVVEVPSEDDIRNDGIDRDDWVDVAPPDYVTPEGDYEGETVEDEDTIVDESDFWGSVWGWLGRAWELLLTLPDRIVGALEGALARWFVPQPVADRLVSIRASADDRFPLAAVALVEDAIGVFFVDTCSTVSIEMPYGDELTWELELGAFPAIGDTSRFLTRIAAWMTLLSYLWSMARRFLGLGGTSDN